MNYTAILIGATGLVGSNLLHQLLKDPRYATVLVFHRRATGVSHPKLTEHIIDFNDVDSWKSNLKGNHLFSALGTTLKKAGGKDEQYKIDYTYQYEIAKAAAESGITGYALVSSIGANSGSNSFYTRIKGELDEAVQALPFSSLLILRPSFLDGDRDEFRFGEQIGLAVAKVVCKIPGLKKYHPIKAYSVASAMIEGLNSKTSGVIEGNDILKLNN